MDLCSVHHRFDAAGDCPRFNVCASPGIAATQLRNAGSKAADVLLMLVDAVGVWRRSPLWPVLRPASFAAKDASLW